VGFWGFGCYSFFMLPETPIENISGVTPALAKKFQRLGISTIRDLLFHFPFRYDDFSNVKEIADVAVGEVVTIRGVLKSIKPTFAFRSPRSGFGGAGRRMNMAEAIIGDATGQVRVIWFNQSYLAKTFHPGETLSISGKPSQSKRGIYFANPAHERVSRRDGLTHTSGLVPVYPETTGLTSRWIRFLTKQVLPATSKISDSLPPLLRKRQSLLDIGTALWQIHFPASMAEAEAARRRFAFEEIFLIQLRVLRERHHMDEERASAIKIDVALIKEFVASLPFPLTKAQRRVSWDIVTDTAKARPMNRILEGDVGSGKTVVATLAALNAVKAGFQVAYLAPTEILAQQHFATFTKLLADFDVAIGLLTASQKKIAASFGASDKANIAALAASGEAEIIIGTHAVIQKNVTFANLGLVVVDEQHRFGVNQRAKLQRQATKDKRQRTRNAEKGISDKRQDDLSPVSGSMPHALLIPHFLSMTATPIPRTLALTVYGDLDVSILDQVPAGRKPILTKVVPAEKRAACYGFIRKEVKSGRQVFVICPRIEVAGHTQNLPHSSQQILGEEVKTVKAEAARLSKDIFPDLRVGLLHGKLKPAEKEKVMCDFRDRKFDILVSTSVVEVGVDIPNASVMLIEGAEKFGLAQIHQFRGRVGRGEYQSYCFLMSESPFAAESARIKAIVSAKNGFELAEKDLAIRGPGDFLGTRQSGIPPFAYKSFTDAKLVQAARTEAAELIAKDASLSETPLLKSRLEEFEAAVHFE